MFVITGLSKCALILKFVITKYNLLVATTPALLPTFSVRYFAITIGDETSDLFHHRLFHNYTCEWQVKKILRTCT